MTSKLSFEYNPVTNLLSFHSDEVVEQLYRSIEVNEIKSIEILSDDDFETFLPADDLLVQYSTLFEIYLGATDPEVFGVRVLLTDETEFTCIFDFTQIKAPSIDILLQRTFQVFEHFGYSSNYIRKLITMLPNQELTIEQTIKI